MTEFLIVGSSGLVGSSVLAKLKERKLDAVGVSSKDADLRSAKEAFELISYYKPRYLIDCAAKVGGIKFNDTFPVEFLLDNIDIQNNLMRASHEIGVERFVFLGSSCIYPRLATQPIKEFSLMTGPLEPTNSSYAMAKIAGIQLVDSYRKQYGHKWISLMPTNIYGPNDNFNLETSHVIPALINKFISAKLADSREVEVWGSGNVRREFLFSQDLAIAILFCLEKYDESGPLNIGTGEDITIRELAELLAEFTEFEGKIQFNKSYPDGTPRKLLDVSRINKLGWEAQTSLRDGLKSTVEWYVANMKDRKRF